MKFINYPMVQGLVFVFATLFVLVNLSVDVIYTYVNPKVRYD